MKKLDAKAVDNLIADAQSSIGGAAMISGEEGEDDLKANLDGVLSSLTRWRCELRRKHSLTKLEETIHDQVTRVTEIPKATK
jgi:hypothetical protein